MEHSLQQLCSCFLCTARWAGGSRCLSGLLRISTETPDFTSDSFQWPSNDPDLNPVDKEAMICTSCYGGFYRSVRSNCFNHAVPFIKAFVLLFCFVKTTTFRLLQLFGSKCRDGLMAPCWSSIRYLDKTGSKPIAAFQSLRNFCQQRINKQLFQVYSA